MPICMAASRCVESNRNVWRPRLPHSLSNPNNFMYLFPFFVWSYQVFLMLVLPGYKIKPLFSFSLHGGSRGPNWSLVCGHTYTSQDHQGLSVTCEQGSCSHWWKAFLPVSGWAGYRLQHLLANKLGSVLPQFLHMLSGNNAYVQEHCWKVKWHLKVIFSAPSKCKTHSDGSRLKV